jgi:hypothetical protein
LVSIFCYCLSIEVWWVSSAAYFLLLTSTNWVLALLVVLVFLINLAANKQLNRDKKQFVFFVPQNFNKQFFAH